MNGKLILESMVGLVFGAVALAAILQQLTHLQSETLDLRTQTAEHSALHLTAHRLANGLTPDDNPQVRVREVERGGVSLWVVQVGARHIEVPR